MERYMNYTEIVRAFWQEARENNRPLSRLQGGPDVSYSLWEASKSSRKRALEKINEFFKAKPFSSYLEVDNLYFGRYLRMLKDIRTALETPSPEGEIFLRDVGYIGQVLAYGRDKKLGDRSKKEWSDRVRHDATWFLTNIDKIEDRELQIWAAETVDGLEGPVTAKAKKLPYEQKKPTLRDYQESIEKSMYATPDDAFRALTDIMDKSMALADQELQQAKQKDIPNYEDMKYTIKHIQELLYALRNRLSRVRREATDPALKDAADVKRIEVDNIRASKKYDLDEILKTNENSPARLAELKQTAKEDQATIESKDKELQAKDKELQDKTQELEELKRQLAEQKREIEMLRQKTSTQQTEITVYKENEQRTQSHAAKLQAAMKKMQPGVFHGGVNNARAAAEELLNSIKER